MNTRNRILIVDDDCRNTAIVERILGRDYDLTTVYDGENALRIAEEIHPDIVLLDIMLPGIDGYEVCRRLKANKHLHNVKIIMVSARAMIDEKLEGYESGADDYVTKPFEGDELLAKVRVYLRLKTVEELDELKSNLLMLLSHETRTPLTYVTAAVENLQAMEELSDGCRDLVEMIATGTVRISDLLAKALRYGNLKSGQTEFKIGTCRVEDVISAAVSQVAERCALDDVKIRETLTHSMNIAADINQLADAFKILLENAIRFSPPGGEVLIETKDDGEGVVVSIVDHGPGIPDDQMKYLLSGLSVSDVTHHSRGHGLNLASVACLIDAHGGRLEVSSEADKRTAFDVHLPRVEQPEPADPETVS